MSARLLLVGIFAVIDRLRKPHAKASPGYNPRVAVLIPAYNEEKVIVRTIRSVLNSDYKNLHVIVIDDGSSDRTCRCGARGLRRRDRRRPRARCSPSPTAARPPPSTTRWTASTKRSMSASTPTPSSPPTPSPSSSPTSKTRAIGAMAGNAKVGNRVNLWTRWQALEYITSQNFERRALDLFHVVTVVPGAIGAWRTAPVKAAGGYPVNTVAEDADLTMNLLEQGFKVDYEDRVAGLHRGAHRRQGTHAPALPLVLRHPAGGLEASRRLRPQQGHGPVRPAQHPHLPDAAAAGLALHRHHVPGRHRQLLHRPALPPRCRLAGQLREAAGLLPRLPAHRLRHLVGSLLAWSAAIPPTRATDGCSSTSGCSASPTARSSPSSCSRPSSAPSTASPSTGTRSSAPPR